MTGEEVVPIPAPELAAPAVPEASSAAIKPVVPPATPVEPAMPVWNRFKAFEDVPFHLTIEIGRLQVSLRALFELKPGKVFRIGKQAGEPFDICANGQPVARGEVTVVENSSGVRITKIIKL